ncbi:WAT1-related protein [Parasponia andersonii]|uniref:WAT1-related protein n=1 Tax=Parasponia andersonii TaxID=3476 RepID=A0A2P5BF69_PARAD|nr:WAT1-related protein [Parasponia andersonii]
MYFLSEGKERRRGGREKMAGWDCKKEVIPFMAMAAMECINVSLNTLYKAAAVKGLSYFVFVTYSYGLGTIVLLPLIFIFPRTGLPPFKPSIFYRIVLLSLVGFAGNMCIFKGIEYSSPTLASAISNLSPAFTFVLAVIFRMETLDFRSSSTLAKTLGTVLSISGALIAILYNGPIILSSPSPQLTFSVEYPLETSQTHWVLGGLLLVAFCMLVSIWYILQTQLIKSYPAELTVVVLYSLCTAIIAAITCFIAGTDINAWTLRTDMALVTIVLFGFFGPSFSAAVHTWGLHLKGPVYVTIFRPISIVIAAVMGVILLGDALHIGSVLGATILLIGFYAVIWGKAKEELSKDCASEDLETSTDRKTPLLRG